MASTLPNESKSPTTQKSPKRKNQGTRIIQDIFTNDEFFPRHETSQQAKNVNIENSTIGEKFIGEERQVTVDGKTIENITFDRKIKENFTFDGKVQVCKQQVISRENLTEKRENLTFVKPKADDVLAATPRGNLPPLKENENESENNGFLFLLPLIVPGGFNKWLCPDLDW